MIQKVCISCLITIGWVPQGFTSTTLVPDGTKSFHQSVFTHMSSCYVTWQKWINRFIARSDPAPAGSEDMAHTINPAPDVSYPDIESASLDSVPSSLPCSQISDPDDSVDERGSLRLHWDAAVTDDRHSIHSTASVYVDGLAVVSKVGLGNGKPGCQNYSCMYGGGLSRDDIDYIYKCFKCEGPHTSALCAKCMLNGGCCEPGHDNWELIT